MTTVGEAEFIKVSDLQRVTAGKLKRLTGKPVFVTEHSRPRYVLLKLEDYEERKKGEEYLYLVPRPHAWKKQFFIKGRNMSAAQLIRHLHREGWMPERAAQEFSLPLEAVLEAIHYFNHHQKLIEMEELEEKRRLEDLSR